MLKDQNIPEKREFEMVKIWPDLPCRCLKKNILHWLRTVSSQHLLFSSSRREGREKRGERSSIQEDINIYRMWVLLPVRLQLLQLFGHHLVLTNGFVIHPSPLVHSQQPGHLCPKAPASHWMTGRTKQGWLMLLRSQILISRWFVLPPSVLCRDGRGSQKLFLCLEPNKELTCPAECVLWSVGTWGGQSISWFHEADWNTITQQARGSSPLRLPSHLCFLGTIITAGDFRLQLGWTQVQSYQGVSDILG